MRPMTALVFVDTNVLLYAIDDADVAKQRAALGWREALWKSRLGRISYQVLQEFYANAVAKRQHTRDGARNEIRDLSEWSPVAATPELLEDAWRIQDRYKISFWDAAIVAAAGIASCKYLLTEDLQDGCSMNGIVVVNPFKHLP